MATKVEFKRVQTDAEVENIDIKDGQLIYTGTGKTYMDYGTERIPTGSGSIALDTEMSDTSENAVQNKVIKEYVDSQTVPEEVIVSDTQPTGNDWKLWIDSDKQEDNTYYNDNGTPTNIKTTTFDTLPVGTEVDYDGQTVPSGWTEVDDPNTYSADEVRIGTWFGKPLYRKVFQYNDLSQISSGSYGVITTGLQNVSFVKFEAINFFNNVRRLMPYNDGTNSLSIVSINNDIRIYIRGTVWNDSANYLIVSSYYTKTTD